MDESLLLPCGRKLPNRFVKAAMYEAMANFGGGPPTEQHLNLYSQWALGGWGMVITGNVQVSSSHLTLGRDITLPVDDHGMESFRSWARSMKPAADNAGAAAIMQLSHAGRQSPRFIGGRYPWMPPSAPSPNPMVPKESMLSRLIFSILFQSPRAMSIQEIDSVAAAFLEGAKVACRTGFDGVQLHASHGYLLSQFLSVKNNHRPDNYGPPSELRLLSQIVHAIRVEPEIPGTFIVGIKLNAGDYANDHLVEAQALSHVRSIAEWKNVDFLEISGGDYESPDFLAKDNPRQAFFASFSRQARDCAVQTGECAPKILLTGSIRSIHTIDDCLNLKHADLIGIGRPSILYPDLPLRIFSKGEFPPTPDTPVLPRWLTNALQVKLVGAGLDTAMWVRAMKRVARKDGQILEGNVLNAFFNLFFNTDSTIMLCSIPLIALGLWALRYYILH